MLRLFQYFRPFFASLSKFYVVEQIFKLFKKCSLVLLFETLGERFRCFIEMRVSFGYECLPSRFYHGLERVLGDDERGFFSIYTQNLF